MFVYKITNLINGNFYIGVSQDFRERFAEHKRCSVSQEGVLYDAIRKYGIENFDFSVIFCAFDRESMFQAEVQLIEELNPEYNCTKGGEGGDTSSSEKYIHYMKEIRPNQISGPNNPFFGKKHTEETKLAISKSKLGKPISESHKEAIVKSLTGRIRKESSSQKAADKNSQWWEITHPDGNVQIVKNLSEFCRLYNLSQANMISVANGEYKKSKGFGCKRCAV